MLFHSGYIVVEYSQPKKCKYINFLFQSITTDYYLLKIDLLYKSWEDNKTNFFMFLHWKIARLDIQFCTFLFHYQFIMHNIRDHLCGFVVSPSDYNSTGLGCTTEIFQELYCLWTKSIQYHKISWKLLYIKSSETMFSKLNLKF